ncbi:putative Ig domain-containing protein, partial [Solihabitans fulvus]
GLGTPNGVGALKPGGGNPPPSDVTVANPGDQTSAVNKSVSLNNSATGGTTPYQWSASSLPTGLSIDA